MKSQAVKAEIESSKVPSYVYTATELLNNDITDIPTLIDPIFPKTGVIALAGSSDTGKSSLLRQLAMDIASNKETFLGFPIRPKHNSVIYVSTEDDYYALSSTLKKQNSQGLDTEKFNNLRFIFDTNKLLDKIINELKRQPADLIIIDAFADLYGADMNRVNEVRNYIQNFSNMASEYECLIIFLHHTSKNTETRPPSKNNMIGSQGFEAKMRVVVELRKDFENPSSNNRHFCIVKGNYLDESYKNESYVLRFSNNLTFENLNQRVPFEELGESDGRTRNNVAIRTAVELRQEGNTIEQVHELMQSRGYSLSRSTVGNYLRGVEPRRE